VLTPGTQLGPYEIVAAIGAGGMGEVYRARDARLGRDVAIKVSSESFTDRFEREARAVAILNHPNICTLYDIGPNYLVMEYIEGAPLKGPMPLAQALKYAAQICDALDAAHRKHIIHRDLKPANVLVTKAGVKVLDFGLARMGAPVVMDETTLTKALTAKGEILGTLHYMSPEQLQGREAEAPSDIFSFGLVLYELLTGTRAFDGPSPASVIAAILERPAPSIGDVAPPALERILQRCLDKDPDARWQSARDLRNELDWIARGPASSPATTPPLSLRRIGSSIGWIAAGVLALALAFTMWTVRRPAQEPALITFELNSPDGEFYGGGFPVISPNGRMVAGAVFDGVGQRRLAVRRLDSPAWQKLPGTEGGSGTAWSHDNRYLAFIAGTRVKKIDVTGGPPQSIADVPGGWIPYMAWGPDGVILFSRRDGLWKVPASGGNAVQVTALDPALQEDLNGAPQFLPDGHHFLFLGRTVQAGKGALYVGSIDGSGAANRSLIFPATSSAIYADGAGAGYLLFEREGALMAQPFDAAHTKLTGEPFLVASQVGLGGSAVAASASRTGVLVWSSAPAFAFNTQLAWFDRNGKPLGDLGSPGTYVDFALAPDGRRLALARNVNRDLDLWLLDLATAGMTRFTFDPATDRFPVWSPDSSKIVYTRSQSYLYEKTASGTGERQLTGVLGVPTDWSRDGHSILVRSSDGDLWALTDGKAVRITQTPFNESQAQFSPDGKWIAFVSNESKQAEVYVQAFPAAGEKFPISTAGGTQPRWRGDGAELFYVALDGKLMAVTVKTGAGFEHAAPAPLFDVQVTDSGTANVFDYLVAGDGPRFLVRTLAKGSRSSPVTVTTNWLALARK